jgi:AcrR family transcriptional regulator
VSPQRSNRAQLIDGTLRCLERLPPERVTARAIAREAGANLASITYHFGSKDALVTEAVIAGLDRWLAELARAMEAGGDGAPGERFRRGWEAVQATIRDHSGLAATFVAAAARARHDPQVRTTLAAGFHRARPEVATALALGDDPPAQDAAGLAMALFYGLLVQTLLDPTLTIDDPRLPAARTRLATLLTT